MSIHIFTGDLMQYGYLSDCCSKPINFSQEWGVCIGCNKRTKMGKPAISHFMHTAHAAGLYMNRHGELTHAHKFYR